MCNILHFSNGNNYRNLLFTDLNATYIMFTDIINHAKVFSVKVMSVINMTDQEGAMFHVKTKYKPAGDIYITLDHSQE